MDIATDDKEILIPIGWIRELWAMKSQWSKCPACGASSMKPENVHHSRVCAFDAALRGEYGAPGSFVGPGRFR